MSTPSYIRTNWYSGSHSTLRFITQNDVKKLIPRVCQPDTYAKGISTDPAFVVEVYTSSFQAWEYEESSHCLDSDSEEASIDDLDDFSNKLFSSGANHTHWKQFVDYWNQWKDVYVSFAWCERFRSIAKEDLVKWHDEYATDYPYMKAICSKYDGLLDSEKLLTDQHPGLSLEEIVALNTDETEKANIIQDIYEEYSALVYWVQLKSFFKVMGITINDQFISDLKFDKIEPYFLLDEHENETNDVSTTPCGIDTSTSKQDSVLATGDVNEKISGENDSNTILKQEDSNHVAGSTNGEIGMENFSSTSLLNGDSSGAKTSQMESCVQQYKVPKQLKNLSGLAWAIKYIHNLHNDKSRRYSSSSTCFEFGLPDSKPCANFNPQHISNENMMLHPTTIDRKRKYDELVEKELQSVYKTNSVVSVTPKPGILWQFVSNTFFRLRQILSFPWIIIRGFAFVCRNVYGFSSNLLMRPLVSGLLKLLDPKRGLPDVLRIQEQNCVCKFRSAVKPLIRKLPHVYRIHSNAYLNKVMKRSNTREGVENLVELAYTKSQCGRKNELSVTYLTEEDCDAILGNSIEFPSAEMQEPSTSVMKPHTLYDAEGNVEEVYLLPVEEAKTRLIDANDVDEAERKHSKKQLQQKLLVSSNDEDLNSQIVFGEDGNFQIVKEEEPREEHLHAKIKKILKHYSLLRYKDNRKHKGPADMPNEIQKYWRQRYRLFLRFDDGIRLDNESWFSVTPEMLAAHQADRCRCDVVIDAFCGAGGNAIQLAAACYQVIAIDIDAGKIAMARKNAEVYGVADRINFIQGDFFKLAQSLKGDVVFLSPPWGGIEYNADECFNVFKLGCNMDGELLYKLASQISSNVAMYLPKNSNIYQLIELAGESGKVDIEYNYYSNKRKSMTAYFGDLVYYGNV